jgi:hypothetical protein
MRVAVVVRRNQVEPMNRDQQRQTRRASMQGVLLLALAVAAAIAAVVTGSVWLVAVALVFLAPGVVMLYRVGKSLS